MTLYPKKLFKKVNLKFEFAMYPCQLLPKRQNFRPHRIIIISAGKSLLSQLTEMRFEPSASVNISDPQGIRLSQEQSQE